MSITAIYVFTSTAFTTSKATVLERLSKDSPGAPDGYSIVAKTVSGEFTLDPGAYRLKSGTSFTPGASAVNAVIPSATGAVPTGFKISDIPSTKTHWPDPPAKAASAALGIPLSVLVGFLSDAGEATELASGAE